MGGVQLVWGGAGLSRSGEGMKGAQRVRGRFDRVVPLNDVTCLPKPTTVRAVGCRARELGRGFFVRHARAHREVDARGTTTTRLEVEHDARTQTPGPKY